MKDKLKRPRLFVGEITAVVDEEVVKFSFSPVLPNQKQIENWFGRLEGYQELFTEVSSERLNFVIKHEMDHMSRRPGGQRVFVEQNMYGIPDTTLYVASMTARKPRSTGFGFLYVEN